jgi:hypothetical protein
MRVGHTLFLAASMMIGSWPAQAACLPVDDFARQLAANSPSRRGREAAFLSHPAGMHSRCNRGVVANWTAYLGQRDQCRHAR